MIAIISHHIVGCDKGRYISACFFGQVIVNLPIVGFTIGAADCFIDSAGTAIVGCNHEIPVTVNIIHLFEVACGSPSRLDWVATFVHKTIRLQSVNLSRTDHELPQTGSSGTRYG